MTPAMLRNLAIQAASRGEWIKAADLKTQADDLARLERFYAARAHQQQQGAMRARETSK